LERESVSRPAVFVLTDSETPADLSALERRPPPYVEILVIHARLSIYSSVINHPTAPIEVRRFFRAAGLSAALSVMRAAVQGEGQLKSMPNNTAIMISFAACFASSLGAAATGNKSILAPSVRNLILETADVLERIGTTPSHRKSLPALYGRHLRELVRHSTEQLHIQKKNKSQSNAEFGSVAPARVSAAGAVGRTFDNNEADDLDAFFSQQPLLFSAMSDSQIIEAINNAGSELDMSHVDFQVDDEAGLIWRDWVDLA